MSERICVYCEKYYNKLLQGWIVENVGDVYYFFCSLTCLKKYFCQEKIYEFKLPEEYMEEAKEAED
jgi:hypothetical protein